MTSRTKQNEAGLGGKTRKLTRNTWTPTQCKERTDLGEKVGAGEKQAGLTAIVIRTRPRLASTFKI